MAGTKYQIIEGESNPTYIPSSRCGPMVNLFGSGTGTQTWHPITLRYEMFGVWPDCNSRGVYTFSRVDLSFSKVVGCITACPHIDEGRLACRSRGLVTS